METDTPEKNGRGTSHKKQWIILGSVSVAVIAIAIIVTAVSVNRPYSSDFIPKEKKGLRPDRDIKEAGTKNVPASCFIRRGNLPHSVYVTCPLRLSQFAVRAKYIYNLVDVELLHVLTSRFEILTWVEVSRMLEQMLTDSCCHSKT